MFKGSTYSIRSGTVPENPRTSSQTSSMANRQSIVRIRIRFCRSESLSRELRNFVRIVRKDSCNFRQVRLTVMRSQVFIFHDCEAFDKESLRIIVRTGHVHQAATGNQAAFGYDTFTNYLLPGEGLDAIRIASEIALHAVNGNALNDISGNQAVVISCLLQISGTT